MSSDPHQGGDLSDLAAHGTSIPGDAGKQNVIPSKARPDQAAENPLYTKGGIGAPDPQSAVDNPTDIPRQNKDIGATGEVITGTGDQLPAQIESKRLHFSPNNPSAKGHDRAEKHANLNRSQVDRFAGEGSTVDPVPGEDEDDQDVLRDSRERKEV